MFSKTQLAKRIQRKNNPDLVETLFACKKNEAWLEIGKIISSSRRNLISVNLEKINKETKEGDTVIIPGKVLSQGLIDKKIKIVALGFSKMAREKLRESKSEILLLTEEINKNPKAEGIKIIR